MYKKFTRFFCTPPGYIHKFLLVMKLTTILIIAAFLQVSAATFAQQVTYKGNKVTLEQMIKEIRKQTGYNVLASANKIDKIPARAVDFKAAPVTDVLQTFLADQPLTYVIDGQTIFIKDKDPKTTELQAPKPVPPVTVIGRVTDTTGTSLIGATVAVKGSSKATITNEKGEFTLGVNEGDVIVFSYIGYKPFEFTTGPSNPYVTITLHPLTSGLKEVVVSTGYQNLPQERVTGSFAHVDNQLFNRRTGTDVLSRLEGVVPGLLTNRNTNIANGTAGADISIRGYSTLYADAQPLIVVDNFPYDGAISNINPNDVEDVTVLKDAAAASIWGVKSGNGVIVITTKKGKRNQELQVEANANVSIADKPNLYYDRNFIDANDFINVEQLLFSKGYYDTQLINAERPPVSPVVQLLANQRSGLISAADATSQINTLRNYDVRDDLTKYFYQKDVLQQYSINFRGGSNKSDYVFSTGYDNHLATQIGNKNDRLTINSLLNFYPVKNLTLTTGINFTKASSANNSPVGNINTGADYQTNIYPYARLVGSNGQSLPIVKGYNYSWIIDPTAQAGLLDWQYRPLDELHNTDNTTKSQDVRVITGAKYSFLNSFSFDLKYQYENATTTNENYYNQDTFFARDLINRYTDLTGATKYPIPVGGIDQLNYSSLASHRGRMQLNFNNRFNSDHEIAAIGGAEISQTKFHSFSPDILYGFDKDRGTFQNVDFLNYYQQTPSFGSSKIPAGSSYSNAIDRYVSYFSNASYTYKDRYSLSASARIDKSNLFGVNTNQKAAPLYSIGLAWDFSKEKFINSNFVTYGKLRATYGYNGNVNKSASGVTTINYVNNSYYAGLPYAFVFNPGNPELRWEKIRMINLGVDFGLIKNTITGSLEYYQKKGIDLFSNASLPPSTGLSTFFGNTANTAGKGVDLVLNTQIVRKENFKWMVSLLYSYSLDKVTKYDAQSPVASTLLAGASAGTISPIVGNPIFSIYSYKSGPLTHETGDPQGYLNGKLSTNYASIISQTSIDSLKFNGSARPTSYGSLRNTFTYKNLSLSANILYKFNYYFRRSSINYETLFSTWVGNSDFNQRWQQPGDENKTTVPSMPDPTNIASNRGTFYSYSNTLVDKGDHIRLQDISLSYNWQRTKIFGNTIKSVQIYGYVNNLGIIWRANKHDLDPDVYSGYPQPRSYSIGLKANF